jgi:hypothetical protein
LARTYAWGSLHLSGLEMGVLPRSRGAAPGSWTPPPAGGARGYRRPVHAPPPATSYPRVSGAPPPS